MSSAVSDLANATNRPDWVSRDDIDVSCHQRVLSKCVDDASFNDVLDSAPDLRSRALALSTALPHAGDWLNVIPCATLGLHLQDWEFCLCLQYWLGLRMCGEGDLCPVCHGAADAFGNHHVGCGGNGDRIHRHGSIRDALFSAAQTAALAPRMEVPSLIPGSRPMFTYPTGREASQLPLTLQSYLLSNSRPWLELPTLLGTLSVWAKNEK